MEITVAYYVGFLIMIVIVIYVVLAYYRNPERLESTPFDVPDGSLETPNVVADADKTRRFFQSPSSSTLMAYVYLKATDKTSRMGQVSNTLLQIPDLLQLNTGQSDAELLVNTYNTSTRETKQERILLPPFPTQKWIQLTILRDGRRFDILYNDKIVASKRLEFMPPLVSAALTFGGLQIRGVYRQGRFFNYRLSLQQVRDELSDTSDTRNKPPTDITMTIGNPFSIFTCPGGFFCRGDGRQPKNALQEWETPYA
jgi:hypothetical protein